MRYSPAGIPIARFLLEHHSQRNEAELLRQVRCRIPVVAAGDGFRSVVERIAVGTLVRVSGFLTQGGGRSGEYRLVLHADRIELID